MVLLRGQERHFRLGPATGFDALEPTRDAMKSRSRAGGKSAKLCADGEA